jgi:hypothetical protein
VTGVYYSTVLKMLIAVTAETTPDSLAGAVTVICRHEAVDSSLGRVSGSPDLGFFAVFADKF